MNQDEEKKLKSKAEAYCSAAERCPSDVMEKLRKWGASEEMIPVIVAHLEKERYLDASRFCRFFVRDKYRFNQWGRLKIVQALRMKQLDSAHIQEGLEEIDDQEYFQILGRLLKQKARGVKAASAYERNVKLMRFAAGRGFTMDEIQRVVKQVDTDEPVD
ncbi:regulatory protein RecX [uncultured Phocaeicola sp.]|uniref:regulatory protein RecX n=1 Tax=uncultured Phocaeicola sp. TaxID=990718 RepID=UPI0025F5712B|nr:regulatory protein RecX [uncultured Phocaeicola sp.]